MWAGGHVLVLEDVIATDYDAAVARDREPRGIFRDRVEWLELFELLGFDVVATGPCNDSPYFQHTMEFFALRVRERAELAV